MQLLESKNITFPDFTACDEDGLLYIGGKLNPSNVLHAYKNGIFPWFQEENGVHWYCPDPRFVLYPNELKVSKSMLQLFKKNAFEVSFNNNFKEVMFMCAEVNRIKHGSTWIDSDFMECYSQLATQGYGVSVEVWKNDRLVGGLYGLKIGKIFFGESMFSIMTNASKYGFITLVKELQEKGLALIDCQTRTTHLESLGGRFIDRQEFIQTVKKNVPSRKKKLH